ncbi:MAG: type II toxin-antitoxin system HicB family antitoxin [Ignavibacteriales bacterium]|nr:type II toxin-antitoxin system HicB family antitoxin [Ignavibacteriales bacterium]
MKYLVIIEKSGNGFSAYSPDVPGCVAAAETIEETEALMAEALEFHLEDIPETERPIPQTKAVFMNVAA